MNLNSLIQSLGAQLPGRKRGPAAPPTLVDVERFPYGPFRFRTRLAKGTKYSVLASTDLLTWPPLAKGVSKEEVLEYVDSEAFKFSCRFYRLSVTGIFSANVIGYASVSLPPGFAMVANPFNSSHTVSDVFKGWPDATSLITDAELKCERHRILLQERDAQTQQQSTTKRPGLTPETRRVMENDLNLM